MALGAGATIRASGAVGCDCAAGLADVVGVEEVQIIERPLGTVVAEALH